MCLRSRQPRSSKSTRNLNNEIKQRLQRPLMWGHRPPLHQVTWKFNARPTLPQTHLHAPFSPTSLPVLFSRGPAHRVIATLLLGSTPGARAEQPITRAGLGEMLLDETEEPSAMHPSWASTTCSQRFQANLNTVEGRCQACFP